MTDSARIDVGFTGTRQGLTPAQRSALDLLLGLIDGRETTLHHGDCVGADEEAHEIARALGWAVEVYPSDLSSQRAYVELNDGEIEHAPRGPLLRNRDIVKASALLVACPRTAAEEVRSGTWATVRFGRHLGRTGWIVQPSGKIVDLLDGGA